MPVDDLLSQLLSLPKVLATLLSPDGRWAAFVWYRRHANLDVFVVPTDGSQPPVALTHTPEATELVSWTADSQSVIVEEDHDGDERVRLFRVGLARPGVMVPLTEDRPPYFIRGGHLHPDGSTLFYGANYDFETGKLLDATRLYRHDLRSGQRRAIARPARPEYQFSSLNQQGTHLLYSRKELHPAGRQFYLVDVDGREDREILNFGADKKVFARWFPDGERILVISESVDGRKQEHQSLGVYHWPSGSLRWLVDDPQRTLEGAWVSPDGAVVVDEVVQATHQATWIDQAGQEHAFPRLPGNLRPLGRTPEGEWVGLYYSAANPTEIVRFDQQAAAPQDLRSLTRVWEVTALRANDLTAVERFGWRSVDGLPVQGWLYRARPNLGRAVIYIHGGPTMHTEDDLNAQIQYLAALGFNVLDVNYRGSTGFGLKFRQAIKEDGWGGREQADIAAGAQTLIEAGLAQPGRVGVTGTSYGGYSSWCQITRYPPELVAAAAPICGMTDLVVDYETTRPDLRPLSEEMIGGSPQQIPDKYIERSPIHFVQNIRGRLLIVQGAQDPNVTPENVHQVRQRLEAHGIPYDLLVFEDEGHGIAKPANQQVLYNRLAQFFDQALGAKT